MQRIAERSEFEHKRIVAAVQRGDVKTVERLLGPVEAIEFAWGMSISLAVLELQRSAARPRCRRVAERAYTGSRLLKDAEAGEDAATVLCDAVMRLIAANQPWGVLRIAENVARRGGSDERAVGLLAGRLARAHSVALAASLHELNPGSNRPVRVVEMTLEELRGEDGPHEENGGLLRQNADEHAVETLDRVAGEVTAAGETCRIDVQKYGPFAYRVRAVGLAARRRTSSRRTAEDQVRQLRETVDAGLRDLYRAARLRHADGTDRPVTTPADAMGDDDGSAVVAIRHPKLRSFIFYTARAADIEEEMIVALAAEWEIARAEAVERAGAGNR